MEKKIAVIFESSPFDRKGLFNAVHQRIAHLLPLGQFSVDAFCLHSRDNAFTRKVRHNPKVPFKKQVEIDGITYKLLWYRFSVIDDILVQKLGHRPIFFSRFVRKTAALLKDYDMVAAHSYEGGLVALEANRRFGVKYYVTWHGSDIHTRPWANSLVMRQTREIVRHAVMDCYVSDSLRVIGEKIAPDSASMVLYNGVSDAFHTFPPGRRMQVRSKFGLSGRKTVGYAGNFHRVKNVLSLPDIFENVARKYDGPLTFWLTGDGKQRKALVDKMLDSAGRMDASVVLPGGKRIGKAGARVEIIFWGNVKTEAMSLIMNCLDVLVLPSLNEGCPLVCAEAIMCGAAVAGSDVCGITDIVGKDYVAALGEGFADRLSDIIVNMLVNGSRQTIPSQLDWSRTARLEASIING
ncbi:MAG: glycosyltransferase family 4 protein [Candidatus Cryptobacteroides sp.]